jgi:cell division septation protein DedD
MKPAMKNDARRIASIPPRPRQRPPHVARAAYRVQLHALASDAAVRREWRRLRKRHGALLSGLKLTVSPMRAGAGAKTVYRMQLGALSSRARARALCANLRRREMSCMVVR